MAFTSASVSTWRAPVPRSGHPTDVAVADVTNSGEPDLVTPEAIWVPEGGTWKRIAIASGDSVIPFDVDADGDLDLYVSSGSGDHLLRNNLDGTFRDVTETAGLPKGIASRGAVEPSGARRLSACPP